MIKLFLPIIIFAFSSCSQISYSDAIPLLKNAVIGATDIRVDSKFIESREYSFIKVKLGRSAVTIMTLSTISNDGIYKWVNASGESIYTYNGKIIKSEGIVYDMEMFNFRDFDIPTGKSLNSKVNSFDTMLFNPRGFLTQSSSIKFNSINSAGILEYEEKVSSRGFKWNYLNIYQVDQKTNRVIESEQYIHPRYPKVKISFFYK
jgi:hypothetical protein